MIRKTCDSYPISIFIAGNRDEAWAVCHHFCDEFGFCVTLTQTTYIYTGGEEDGVIVGLINYPRFPLSPQDLRDRAEQLAERLCDFMKQDSYSIQAPDGTLWVSRRDAESAA